MVNDLQGKHTPVSSAAGGLDLAIARQTTTSDSNSTGLSAKQCFREVSDMFTFHSLLHRVALLVCVFVATTYSCVSLADDVVSFATGGYASGIRSEDLMHKMNTSGNGMLTKDEWLAFQKRFFRSSTRKRMGFTDPKQS